MVAEEKSKADLVKEAESLKRRVLELEELESEYKKISRQVSWSRISILTAGLFVLLCILIWLNEILDIPDYLNACKIAMLLASGE